MENHWKSFGAIIILFLSIIFVHNTSALTLNMEIEPTGNSWENFQVDCVYSANDTVWVPSTLGSSQWSCNRFPTNTNNYSLNGIRTHDTIHVEEGLYYQGYLILRNPSEGATYPTIYWNFNQSDDFEFITIEELYDDSIRTKFSTYCSSSSSNFDCYSTEQYDNYYVKMYMLTLRAKSTGDVKWQLGPTGNFVKSLNSNDYVLGLRKIVEYQKSGGTAEAEQKTEEASNEGEQNSESAQSDNEAATSSLLDVAGSIISAFGSTASNCSLDMDLGNVDFGNINFCSGKPSEFSGIIDTVIILMLIPLIFMTTISLVHQFINLTKFAQGGD